MIPEWGRSAGERNGNPLQYSCLENSMDGRAWWATVHRVSKSQTRLSDFTFTFIQAEAYGMLVPQPGFGPTPPALEVWSLNYWTARKVPELPILKMRKLRPRYIKWISQGSRYCKSRQIKKCCLRSASSLVTCNKDSLLD